MQDRRPGSGSRGGGGGSTWLVLMGWVLHLPYPVIAGRWGSISASPFTGAQEAISPRKPHSISFLSHQPLRGLDSLGLAVGTTASGLWGEDPADLDSPGTRAWDICLGILGPGCPCVHTPGPARERLSEPTGQPTSSPEALSLWG